METTIRNEKLLCLNCGGDFALKMPIPITEMTKKIDAFNVLHSNCQKTWIEPEADQSKDIQEKAMWWIANGHVGNSSKTMWNCFMGNSRFPINHPYDPDDFSRCYKLLQAVPEWKSKRYMNMLSKLSTPWENLVENWDKLTQMYEQNKAENWVNANKIGMYEFMQTLIR
jgi:hypothetical protein